VLFQDNPAKSRPTFVDRSGLCVEVPDILGIWMRCVPWQDGPWIQSRDLQF